MSEFKKGNKYIFVADWSYLNGCEVEFVKKLQGELCQIVADNKLFQVYEFELRKLTKLEQALK